MNLRVSGKFPFRIENTCQNCFDFAPLSQARWRTSSVSTRSDRGCARAHRQCRLAWSLGAGDRGDGMWAGRTGQAGAVGLVISIGANIGFREDIAKHVISDVDGGGAHPSALTSPELCLSAPADRKTLRRRPGARNNSPAGSRRPCVRALMSALRSRHPRQSS